MSAPTIVPSSPHPATTSNGTFNLIAFYFNDKLTDWDKVYKGYFLGNFYPCKFSLTHAGITAHFNNTEAAFQATKWWHDTAIRTRFEHAITGDDAYQIKKNLKGTEDWSYGGYGDNLKAMRAILDIKFGQTVFKNALLATGDAYLLEHKKYNANYHEPFWSDDYDGTGQNHLGLMLMDIRAALGGDSNPAPGVGVKEFTAQVKTS